MPRPSPDPARSELRAWLKQALRSDLFQKLPPRGPGGRPESVARRLLAELINPGDSDRSLVAILTETRAFRSWVQATQQRARRLILAQVEGEVRRSAESKVEIATPPDEPTEAVEAKDDSPGDHPLWDRWLDGYL